jgi:hypothetical protein
MLSGERDADAQCADEHVTGVVYGLFRLRGAGHGPASRAHQSLASRCESNGPGSADVEGRAEFAFEMFMRHPGEVLTRTQILDHVWDFAYDATSNVVDQYAGSLRRKIDRPFGRRDIETLRGSGYRLRAPRGG